MLGMASKMRRNGCYAKLKSAFPTPSSYSFTPIPYQSIPRSHFCKVRGKEKGFLIRSSPEFGKRFFSNALSLWKPRLPLTIPNSRSYNAHARTRRASFKWFTTDGVVIGLIASNAAVFLLWKVADTDFMVKNFMISVDNIKSGRVHTLITSAFTHHDTFHFATNMLGLYFFGKSIGQCLGHQKLLKLYLTGALAGSVLYLGYHSLIVPKLPSNHPYGKAPAQGASGAISALVELGVFMYPLTFVKPLRIDFVIRGPALLLGIFIITKDMQRLYEGNTGFALLGGSTVAMLAWFSLVVNYLLL